MQLTNFLFLPFNNKFRFIGTICCFYVVCCAEVKVVADNRVVLRCIDNRTVSAENQSHCALKSTRCLLSGYKIDRKDDIYHPKEAYYISCLIFDKTKINVSINFSFIARMADKGSIAYCVTLVRSLGITYSQDYQDDLFLSILRK